jgi:outer membrane protein assembly factor BamB
LPAILTMSADDETIYLNTGGERFELIAVDVNTGRQLWTAGVGGFHPPMKKDGWLYANGWFSVLVADPTTGTIVRTIKAEAEVTTTPVRAGDLLLFGTINGALHAIRVDESKRSADGPSR